MQAIWRNLPAALVVGALLSACGGSTTNLVQEEVPQEVNESIADAPASQEPVELPEAAIEYATIEQYASVVAESKSEIEEKVAAIGECSLGGWDEGSLECPFAALGMVPIAGILNMRLAGEEDLREDLRLNPPPPEIETLVARTVEATQSAMDASELASDCGDADTCELEWFELNSAARNLQAIIDAWEPYL